MPEAFKKRYKIAFEFNGCNFFGTQKQPDKRTVQNELEKALCTLIKDNVSIIPSGRCDSQVSAKYMTAHFDCFDITQIYRLDNFLYKLNCILPCDIKVLCIEEKERTFHAQKQAKYKHYRYTIQNDHVASVFSDLCLFYPYFDLDIDKINAILSHIEGYHDFSSFKSQNNNPYNDCEIYYAKATKKRVGNHDFIYIDIIGNRFLYNMIRIIVAEILYILRNKLDACYMKCVLEKKNRKYAQYLAQAKGLSLEYVGYDEVSEYISNLQKGN